MDVPSSDPLADSRRSLATGVAGRIEEMILSGAIRPGERINESRLSAQLKVSRAPIREACRRLEHHGLLVTRPNRGAFVCALDDADLADLYDIRIALEELIGRRAAARIDEAGCRRLDELVERMRAQAAAGRSGDYYRTNLRLHALIVEAAGGGQLADTYAGITTRLMVYRIGRTASAEDLAASSAEHAAIVAALRAHDAQAAGRALADHCRNGYRRHLGRAAASA